MLTGVSEFKEYVLRNAVFSTQRFLQAPVPLWAHHHNFLLVAEETLLGPVLSAMLTYFPHYYEYIEMKQPCQVFKLGNVK